MWDRDQAAKTPVFHGGDAAAAGDAQATEAGDPNRRCAHDLLLAPSGKPPSALAATQGVALLFIPVFVPDRRMDCCSTAQSKTARSTPRQTRPWASKAPGGSTIGRDDDERPGARDHALGWGRRASPASSRSAYVPTVPTSHTPKMGCPCDCDRLAGRLLAEMLVEEFGDLTKSNRGFRQAVVE